MLETKGFLGASEQNAAVVAIRSKLDEGNIGKGNRDAALNKVFKGRTVDFIGSVNHLSYVVKEIKDGDVHFLGAGLPTIPVEDLDKQKTTIPTATGRKARYRVTLQESATVHQRRPLSKFLKSILGGNSKKTKAKAAGQVAVAIRDAKFKRPTWNHQDLVNRISRHEKVDLTDLNSLDLDTLHTLRDFGNYCLFGADHAQGIYADNDEFAAKFRECGGTHVRTYKRGTAQGAVTFFKGDGTQKPIIGVSIQGTDDLVSTIADARLAFVRTDPTNKHARHLGFTKYTLEIILDLFEGISRLQAKHPKAAVHFFGHSLGAAAIESLIGFAERPKDLRLLVKEEHRKYRANREQYPREMARYEELMGRIPEKALVYPVENLGGAAVFGSPLGMNRPSASSFDRRNGNRVFSIISDDDPVTNLPPPLLGEILGSVAGKLGVNALRALGANYPTGGAGRPSRVGMRCAFGSAGHLYVGTKAKDKEGFLSRFAVWKNVPNHFMTSYRSKIETHLARVEEAIAARV